MKNKFLTIILILTFSLLLYSCGGINNYVKDLVEKYSPGAEIISVEKAKIKSRGNEVWCITYQPKNGGVERMFLSEGIAIWNVPGYEFVNSGCTD